MKTVIVYYSLDGNTKQAAEALAKATGADICPIEPVKPIVSAGRPTLRVLMQGGGQVTLGLCPKIREFPLDLGSYDRIILGTPVWAGKPASFVRTFVKKYAKRHQLTGKITAVFTLSASGDDSGCIAALRKLLPDIETTVSLTDKSSPHAAENERKTAGFAQSLSD